MRQVWTFSGRAGRPEWWVINGAIALIWAAARAGTPKDYDPGLPMILILLPIILAMCWLAMASSVRRLHDRGKGGRWYVISFIPLVGLIWLIVECGCLRGTTGPNQYGPPIPAQS
ncbi:MAG: DUF805 domain-containing protein [Rhodospirillum sp.]|nr:DUF805 domain-containing protein [Rhodospirillum sp.]